MASAELPSLGSSTHHTAALGGQCWLQSPAINGRHCASLESREAGPGWVPWLPAPHGAALWGEADQAEPASGDVHLCCPLLRVNACPVQASCAPSRPHHSPTLVPAPSRLISCAPTVLSDPTHPCYPIILPLTQPEGSF